MGGMSTLEVEQRQDDGSKNKSGSTKGKGKGKGKVKQSKKGGSSVDALQTDRSAFENPLNDAAEEPSGPEIPAFEIDTSEGNGQPDMETESKLISPRSRKERRIDEQGEDSPRWQENEEAFETEEQLAAEARLGRRGCSYAVLMFSTLLLLPLYTCFAAFMVWTFYIVPNPFSFICVTFACFVPATLWMGLIGARRGSQAQLQLYAFMMILAVTMQASVVVVVLLDVRPDPNKPAGDGNQPPLQQAYLNSCAYAARDACDLSLGGGDLDAELWGGSLLPEWICECAAGTDGSGGGGEMAGCIGGALSKKLGHGKDSIAIGLLATMAFELVLAYLGYTLMADLDIKDAKKLANMKGGAPTGTLRGEIICGVDLCAHNMPCQLPCQFRTALADHFRLL